MQKLPYSQIEKNLKTGDIVLFSGQYSISHFVEKLEGSQWSHSAMIVRLEGYDMPLLWEATALTNLKDVIFGDNKTGPKIVDLYERLKTYGSDVKPYVPPNYAIRYLDIERTDEMIRALSALFTQLHGIPNPGQWDMVWRAVIGRYMNIPVKMDKYTCAELVAKSLITMGLLGDKKVLNAYIPKDFSSDGKLALLKGTYSEEILIDINS